MEIFGVIMIVATVVLPILLVAGILFFLGVLAYSVVKDLGGNRTREPVPEAAHSVDHGLGFQAGRVEAT